MIVDDTRASDVHFHKNTFQILVSNIYRRGTDCFFQFCDFDRAGAIRVNSVELLAKTAEFGWIYHLNEDIETLTSQSALTPESDQILENCAVDRLTRCMGLIQVELVEPGMCP